MKTRDIRDIILYTSAKDAGSAANPYWKRRAPAHWAYVFIMLTLMGVGIGVMSLFVCSAYGAISGWELFNAWFDVPAIAALNIAPCVILVYLFYFLLGRVWPAFGITALAVLAASVVNYYTLRLRGMVFTASEIALAGEAANMLQIYTLELTGRVLAAALSFLFGLLYAVFLMPGRMKWGRTRVIGLALSLIAAAACAWAELDNGIYHKTVNTSERVEFNQWSDTDTYVSRGFVYPFIHSIRNAVPRKPEGYSDARAQKLLASYTDEDIPADKRVNVIAIMLESYCDLSVYEGIGVYDAVYAPLHELQAQSVSGNIISNTYAGGTTDSERNFLTGFSSLDRLSSRTDSFIRYFKSQGYAAEGFHAGDGWFYNRRNIYDFLGYDRYFFMEDMETPSRKDADFFAYISKMYETRDSSVPYFAYDLTYQNHGPYYDNWTVEEQYLSKEGLSDAAWHILNNYFYGIADTSQRMLDFVNSLRDDEAPVVVVFFGDHRPWMGDNSFVLTEAGVSFSVSTQEGFYNYYSAPYIIWANDAAKAALGSDFTGTGEDISACFLMEEVFDQCGWTGSAWMQLCRDTRNAAADAISTPTGLYVKDGAVLSELPDSGKKALNDYLTAEYYLKTTPCGAD